MFQLYPFVPKTLCWTCSSMHMDKWQSFNFCAQKAHFKSNSLKPGDARCYLDVSGPAARGGFFFAPRRHQESSRKNCWQLCFPNSRSGDIEDGYAHLQANLKNR